MSIKISHVWMVGAAETKTARHTWTRLGRQLLAPAVLTLGLLPAAQAQLSSSLPLPTGPWTTLGSEWSGFSMYPTRWVRFGDGVNWVYRSMVGRGYRCDDGLFGGELRRLYPSAFTTGKVRRCEVGAEVFETLIPDFSTMPHSVYGGGSLEQMSLPKVDWKRIPARGHGTGAVKVKPIAIMSPGVAPAGGAFRLSCEYSHFAADDPLVAPGKVGGAHLHMFFGNTALNAYSSSSSVELAGNSTCDGGVLNRSAYWVPALLDASGKPLVPNTSLWYYKNGLVDAGAIKSFPAGLAVIAGNAKRANLSEAANFHWSCGADLKVTQGWNLRKPEMRSCAPGDTLHVAIGFPNCWDGKNSRSTDHKSHMAYSVSRPGATGAPWHVCPASHPVPVPELSLNMSWVVPAGADTMSWRLSSDAYPSDLPGGRSMHADYMNGWQKEALDAMVRTNINQRTSSTNVINDGRQLLMPLSGSAYPLSISTPLTP